MKALAGSAKSYILELEFSDFSVAEEYYYLADHKALQALRNQITEGWAIIVSGDSAIQELVDSGCFESRS